MTDLFKCKRSGQTCCAPKSKIMEKQQFQTRNDTSSAYVHYPLPPPPPPPALTPVGIQAYPPSAYPPPLPPSYLAAQAAQMHSHYPPPPPPPPGLQVPQPNYEYPLYVPGLGK